MIRHNKQVRLRPALTHARHVYTCRALVCQRCYARLLRVFLLPCTRWFVRRAARRMLCVLTHLLCTYTARSRLLPKDTKVWIFGTLRAISNGVRIGRLLLRRCWTTLATLRPGRSGLWPSSSSQKRGPIQRTHHRTSRCRAFNPAAQHDIRSRHRLLGQRCNSRRQTTLCAAGSYRMT